jgi:hypothetical protein
MNETPSTQASTTTASKGPWWHMFLTPATATVIVTAVVGPLAVAWTTGQIEKKKLQAQIIETVLKYTDKADFKNHDEVIRAGVIAKLVQENKRAFGLRFESAAADFDELSKNLRDQGLGKAREDSLAAANEKERLIAKLISDSAAIESLEMERERLGVQLSKEASNGTTRARALSDSIASLDSSLRIFADQQTLTSDRLTAVSTELTSAKTRLRESEEELEKLRTESANNTAELKNQRDLATKTADDAKALKNQLDDVTKLWQEAVDQRTKWEQKWKEEQRRASAADAQAKELEGQLKARSQASLTQPDGQRPTPSTSVKSIN